MHRAMQTLAADPSSFVKGCAPEPRITSSELQCITQVRSRLASVHGFVVFFCFGGGSGGREGRQRWQSTGTLCHEKAVGSHFDRTTRDVKQYVLVRRHQPHVSRHATWEFRSVHFGFAMVL
jgi:hypothetical protein